MTVLVDHSQRRNLILERAFELFAEEGFAGVTYQKIANRCGISRTSIYKYFNDKDQIFIYAIKRSTDKISAIAKKVVARPDLSAAEKLRRILRLTVKLLYDNRVFLSVVLDYLTSLKSSGADVRRKARSRTFGFKFLLTRLVKDAIGEKIFREGNPGVIASRLYCIMEAYVLNLTVTDSMGRNECLAIIDSCLDDLAIKAFANPLFFDMELRGLGGASIDADGANGRALL
ncbi:MAG: TetR/AcrR family transcriptional regulator [Thermoguttaceae bacterium]|nr:TetR/AcrR family transcriptional regulator [Thermoguttaceae bacterium]